MANVDGALAPCGADLVDCAGAGGITLPPDKLSESLCGHTRSGEGDLEGSASGGGDSPP